MHSSCQGWLSSPDSRLLTVWSSPAISAPAARIIICDYNALLNSVTGLLRMSGYAVFQAYDGLAAEELFVPID